jgi:4-amino-4-deoxy-L-arabinose transferase-like glycosyltransferase
MNNLQKSLKSIFLNEKSFLTTVFLLSIALKFAATLYLGHYLNPRTWENGNIADNLLSGKGFSACFLGPEQATSWQAPFYPYFLALFYIIFGRGSFTYLLIAIVQSIITSVVPILVYKSGKIIFNKSTAVLAAILAAFFPLMVWYSTRFHHTAFVFLFITMVFYLFIKGYETGDKKDFLYAGVALGVGVLVEPVIIVFLFAFILWSSIEKGFIFAMRKAVITIVLVLIIIFPWTLRNYQVHNQLIFIKSSFGKEFWLGNNLRATGTAFAANGKGEITNVYPPVIYDQLKNYPEIVRTRMMRDEALNWIRENPLGFIYLSSKKVLYFWWYPPDNLVRQSEEGEAVKYSFAKKAYWSIFLFFFIYGTIVALKRKEKVVHFVLLSSVLYSLVYVLTHVGQQRFRGVIEPVLLIYVAFGILQFTSWIKPNQWNEFNKLLEKRG